MPNHFGFQKHGSMLCQSVDLVQGHIKLGSSVLAHVVHFEKVVQPLLQSLSVQLLLKYKDLLHQLLHHHHPVMRPPGIEASSIERRWHRITPMMLALPFKGLKFIYNLKTL
jgi:hypothetical protein